MPLNLENTEPAENMPEGCFFAYVVSHEAWYASVINGREMSIQAAARDGGVAWEFIAEEVDQVGVQLKIFSDGFPAFSQIPAFFAALSAGPEPKSLTDVIAILDRLGAKDVTERVGPGGRRSVPSVPLKVHEGMVALGWTPPDDPS